MGKLNDQVIQYAMHSQMDKAVALLDKRLVWLKDASKVATHYMLWALAEQKRGLSISQSTTTTGASAESLTKHFTEMSVKYKHEKEQILAVMLNKYTQSSEVTEQVLALQGYTKRIVEWSNGLLTASKSQYEEVTKAIANLK